MAPAQNSILFWSWDNSQEWVELPTMPQSMGYSRGVDGDNLDSLIAVAAEGEIFICDRS